MAGLDAFPRDEQGRLILPSDDLERFWRRVERHGASDCWPWLGPRSTKNYGRLCLSGIPYVDAHRLSFALCNGPLFQGAVIHHRCHNPPCVNPTHLQQTSRSANSHLRRSYINPQAHRPASYNPVPPWKLNRVVVFLQAVRKDIDTGCWFWTAARYPTGYGIFWNGERNVGAHRFAYSVFKGAIPPELMVLHVCHRGADGCVNPDHLKLGTDADNMQDMLRAGRGNKATGLRNGSYTHPGRRASGERHGSKSHPEAVLRGENHPHAKLSNESRDEIQRRRNNGEPLASLAMEFSVSRVRISQIAKYGSNRGART